MAIIGAHVSVAGGLYKAFANAKEIGAECVQIFGASPRQWNTKQLTSEDIDRYFEARDASNVSSVYLHASYLVNLASPDKELWNKSIKNLSEHFKITNDIKANGLVFHIGSGKDTPRAEAIEKTAKGMKKVLANVKGSSFLIMENTAGGGQKLGSSEEIGIIMKKVGSKRVAACLDTAHAFEGGSIEEYTPTNIKKLFDKWDKDVGLKNLVVFHVNDSKTKFDSRHDRHENIGKGYIGLKGFKNLAKEKRVNKLPWILEVPGFEGHGPDKKNVNILKKMFKK